MSLYGKSGGGQGSVWSRILLFALLLIGPSVAPVLAVTLKLGDILVVEPHNAAIFVLDAVTGVKTPISQGTLLGAPFQAVGVALTNDGDVIAVVRDRGLIRINPATGAQSVLSEGGSFRDPWAITIDRTTGYIYVADSGYDNVRPEINGPGKIIRVDPITGAQVVIASGAPCNFFPNGMPCQNTTTAGAYLAHPYGIAMDYYGAPGTLIVADMSSFNGKGSIFRLPTAGGTQTLLWGPSTANPAPVVNQQQPAGCPMGIVVEPTGNILTSVFTFPVPTAVQYPPPDGTYYGCAPPGIHRINLSAHTQTILHSNAPARQSSKAYVVGDTVYSGSATAGHVHRAIQAGSSASSAPTFSTTLGGNTTDGTVVWQNVGPGRNWSIPFGMDIEPAPTQGNPSAYNIIVSEEGLHGTFRLNPAGTVVTQVAADVTTNTHNQVVSFVPQGGGFSPQPERSNGQPSGALSLGTTQVVLSLFTDINATCRYSPTPNTPYSSMSNLFSNTGTLNHWTTVSGLTNNNTYFFYVRCISAAGKMNTTDYAISFSISQSSPPTGAVAAFGFNEGSGSNAADSSGNNNNGTITSPGWTSQGKYGNAISFNGSSTMVTVPDANSLDLTTGMTIEAWLYPTASDGVRDVIIKENTSASVDVYNLYARNGQGVAEANVFVGTGNHLSLGSVLPLNIWTHLAATYDGTAVRLYVNGVQISGTNVAGSISTSSGPLRIGGNSLWGEFFEGRIDEVRVYNRPLSLSEIQTDMSTPVALPGTDVTPPVRSNAAPSGTLPFGTTQTVMSLTTNENATCRYGTTPGVVYSSMSSTFTTTGGTSHAVTRTGLVNGNSYTYYVRCIDAVGNANSSDLTIAFSVASQNDTTPPVRSNGQPTGALPIGTTQTTISLTTNENATCRYGTTPGAYGSLPNTFAVTGGTGHSSTVTSLVGGSSYTYYVRCIDQASNANTNDFSISFTVTPETTPPVRMGGAPSGLLPYGTAQTSMTLTTDENATCRYGTVANVAYASLPNTFSTTGTTSHATTLSALTNGGSYTRYVRCIDTSGNANTNDYVINFSVASTPGGNSSNFSGIEIPLSEGATWDTPGSWTAISKNNGAFTSVLNAAARRVTPVLPGAQYSEITYDQDPGAGSWVGVMTRVQSATNGSGYLAILYAGEVRLYRADDVGDNLGFTQLGSAAANLATAPRRLRLESLGNTHRVYFNGTLLITHAASGTTYSTGQPGIAASVFGGPTVKIVTFESGSLPDTVPPARSSGSPGSMIPYGSTQTPLSLVTDENATCRYGTSAGVAYPSLPNTFSTTGGTSHATTVSGLVNGGSYTYYVRCIDTANNANTNDFSISFSVANTPGGNSSNFTGTESLLSENGTWDRPGSWGTILKNDGAYAVSMNAAARRSAPVLPGGQYSQIVYDQDPGSATWVGVMTRIQSAANGSGYLAIVYAGEVRLYRTDDTAGTLSFTQLAGVAANLGAAPRRLRLESLGNVHRVFLNGVQLIQHTATGTIYSTGQPGIAASVFGGPTVKMQSFESGSITDSAPPILSGASPSGLLPYGTTQTSLGLTSDENATCRYGTVPGVAYGSIPNTFVTTGGTSHATTVTGLAGGNSYTYYVRCTDGLGQANTSDLAISFSVASTPGGNSTTFSGVEFPLSEGGSWDTPGSWVAMVKNNGAYGPAMNSAARRTGPALPGSQYAEIVYDQDPGSGAWIGVATRIQSATNGSGYLAIAFAGEVRLYRTDDTGGLGFTQLASAPASLNTAPRRLRLESTGSTHRVFFNGTLLLTHIASGVTYSTGQPGIAASVFGGPTVRIVSFESGSIPDSTPPVRSNGSPSGLLPFGSTQATLSLATDENATCRYGTTVGIAYASLPGTFSTTGTSHSTTVTGLTNGASYTYYVRCIDTANNANTNDFSISFSVAGTPGGSSSSFSGVESLLSEGGTWDTPTGWASMAKNNGAYTEGVSAQARRVSPTQSSDQFSAITYDQDPGSGSWVGVATRTQSATNGSGYLAIAFNGEVRLYRTDAAGGSIGFTQLGGAAVDLSAAPRRLRLESQGNTHRVYLNDVLLITHVASGTIYSGGQPGIAASVFGGPTVKILTFQGGDLP